MRRSRSPAGRARARRSTARAGCPAARARRRARRRTPATSSSRSSRSRGSRRPARSRRLREPRARTRSRTRPRAARRRARRAAPPSASGTSADTAAPAHRPASTWSTSSAPVRGAYGSTRNVSRSGTSRISPTGPIPSTGWSWSSPFIACIADRQADAAREPPFEAVPAARLRAHGAVVAAPEEADEAEALRVDAADDLLRHCACRSNSSSQRASIDCSSSRAARCAWSVSTSAQSSASFRSRPASASSRAAISDSSCSSSLGRCFGCRLRPRLRLAHLRLRLGLGRGGRLLVAAADVLGPAAVVAANRPVLERERPLGDGVDERAVVRDEQDRPGERLERGFERLARLEVEVVRRLVEHEEVRARGDDVREREPAPLAAGENGDRLLVLVPAGEEEAAEQRLRLRPRKVCRALRRLEHGVPLVELDLLLREVADGDAVAEPHAPAVRLALVEQRLDQRRLPRAVRPDERDVLAALERERRLAQQLALADLRPRARPTRRPSGRCAADR